MYLSTKCPKEILMPINVMNLETSSSNGNPKSVSITTEIAGQRQVCGNFAISCTIS